jgi:hypothetical protein
MSKPPIRRALKSNQRATAIAEQVYTEPTNTMPSEETKVIDSHSLVFSGRH